MLRLFLTSSSMKKRNKFALGKFVAILVAVLLVAGIPLMYLGSSAARQSDAAVRERLDDVLARINSNQKITLEDYELLRTALNGAGGSGLYDIEMSVTSPEDNRTGEEGFDTSSLTTGILQVASTSNHVSAGYLGNSNSAEVSSLVYTPTVLSATPVANHTHSASCFIGHNHAQAGCTWCGGYYTSYNTENCYWCGGSGTQSCSYCTNGKILVANSKNCTTCSGTGEVPKYKEETCSTCGGNGKSTACARDKWHVCGKCNGSGECSAECHHDPNCPVCHGKGCSCNDGANGGWWVCPHCDSRSCSCPDGCSCKKSCSTCRGTGKVQVQDGTQSCSSCGGDGKVDGYENCPNCSGTGRVSCGYCGGSGSTSYYTCTECNTSGSYGQKCDRLHCKVYGYTYAASTNDPVIRCGKTATAHTDSLGLAVTLPTDKKYIVTGVDLLTSSTPVYINTTEKKDVPVKIKVTYLDGSTDEFTGETNYPSSSPNGQIQRTVIASTYTKSSAVGTYNSSISLWGFAAGQGSAWVEFKKDFQIIVYQRLQCPTCGYWYDPQDCGYYYTDGFDVASHCPFCPYIFDKNTDNNIGLTNLNAGSITFAEAYSYPNALSNNKLVLKTTDSKSVMNANTDMIRCIVLKGTSLSSLADNITVRRKNVAGKEILETIEPCNESHTNVTSFKREITSYAPSSAGKQAITVKYTVTFTPFTSKDPSVGKTTKTSTRSLTLYLNVYNKCSNCQQYYNMEAKSGNCPFCSLTKISATPKNITGQRGQITNLDNSVNVVATFFDDHTETISNEFNTTGNFWTSNFNYLKAGSQTVTISLKDYYNTTQTDTVTVNLYGVAVCPVCTMTHALNADGSDPGCPYCPKMYKKLIVTPKTIVKEWNSSMTSSSFNDWVTVKVEYMDGHVETLTSAKYSHNFRPLPLDTSTVTIKATDTTGAVKYEYVQVKTEKNYTCSKCGKSHPALSSNGSDPGCPFCKDIVESITARFNKTTYSLNEPDDVVVTLKYNDGHTIDVTGWANTTFNSTYAGTREAKYTYMGYTCSAGNYTVINNYLITCPNCGSSYDSRNVASDTLSMYSSMHCCANCAYDIVSISGYVTPSVCIKGTTPSFSVAGTQRCGNVVDVPDFTVRNYKMYQLGGQVVTLIHGSLSTTVNVTVIESTLNPGESPTGYPDPVPVNPGTEDPISTGSAKYLTCPSGHTYLANADGTDPGCPYCQYLHRYDEYVKTGDDTVGEFSGNDEIAAFTDGVSNNHDTYYSDRDILEKIVDETGRHDALEEALRTNPALSAADRANILYPGAGQAEERNEYLNALNEYSQYASIDPSELSPEDLKAKEEALAIIKKHETVGFVLKEGDIVTIRIKKVKSSGLVDAINSIFGNSKTSDYFTSSITIGGHD